MDVEFLTYKKTVDLRKTGYQRPGPGLIEFLDNQYTVDYPANHGSLSVFHFASIFTPRIRMNKKIARIKL